MGQLDTDPIPPWAVTCWCDERNVYVALPMTAGGIPYIIKYPLSSGGLASALEVLRKRKAEVIDPNEAKVIFNSTNAQPMVKTSKAQERLYAETTEAQRASARALLLKLGIK
jgi:hypothetical protein